MPRDGLQQYSPPPGTEGIPNYTVESARYNAFVADITQDLNLPRPISSGGTGASSADQALFNLSGEEAAQVVTNWDSMLWSPGSFYAAASALGSAPLAGHAFAGICYINEPLANPPTNQNVIVEARDLDPVLTVPLWVSATVYDIGVSARDSADNTVWKATAQNSSGAATFALARAAMPGVWVSISTIPVTKYIRVKKAGVWGAWTPETIAQSVRYDAVQILTAGEQTQARKNIYAAPFDALAYNGMQVNGSMEVSQELGQTGTTINTASGTKYVLDGWIAQSSGSQVSGCGWNANAPPGFLSCLVAQTTTPNAAPAASDYLILYQRIEGYRAARLAWGTVNAQPLTLGFWVMAKVAGLYSGSVANGVGNRSYAFPFTINSADTWEYKTVTIPGDTVGTWVKDNTASIRLIFSMLCGTTFQAAPNVWLAANSFGVTGTINACAAAANYLLLTGVVVLPGIEAPSAARSPLIMRPYDQELLTCKRYYEKQTATVYAYALATNTAMMIVPYIEKRSPPTANIINSPAIVNGTVPALYDIFTSSCMVGLNATATGLVSMRGALIAIDARL